MSLCINACNEQHLENLSGVEQAHLLKTASRRRAVLAAACCRGLAASYPAPRSGPEAAASVARQQTDNPLPAMHSRLRSGATAEQRWHQHQHRPSFDMVPPPHHPVATAAPSFYIHEDAVFDHTALTECVPGWALDDQSAEVAMMQQLRAHASRTLDPRLATLFVVPVYPYVSLLAGSCAGTEHPARMAAAAAALSRSAWWSRRHGADHMLVTNTFRLGALGALRPLLSNATVAWFEAPSAPRRGPGTLARPVSWVGVGF